MGSKLSRVGTATNNSRIAIRNWIRQVRNRRNERNMAVHVQILAKVLNFGSCKIKIKRNKNSNIDPNSDILSETTEMASNLDLLSGIGTAGGENESNLEMQDDIQNEEVVTLLSAVEEQTAAPAATPTARFEIFGLNRRTRKKKREKSIVDFAIDKLKGEYKTIDLFSYRVVTQSRKLTSKYFFSHALDCHQAFIQLSQRLAQFQNTLVKKKSVLVNSPDALSPSSKLLRNSKQRRSKSKRPQSVMTSKISKILTPGAEFTGTIRVPPEADIGNRNLDQNIDNSQHLDDGFINLGNLENTGSSRMNLDPRFTNIQQTEERPYSLSILRELRDELGQVYWVGRHKTYDGRRDKQTILIQKKEKQIPKFSKNSGNANLKSAQITKIPNVINGDVGNVDVENLNNQSDTENEIINQSDESKYNIYYEDYETHCDGVISEEELTITGDVRQLKEPGFFLQTNGEEYKFQLKLQSSTQLTPVNPSDGSNFENELKVNEMKAKLELIRNARALSFAGWCGSCSSSRINSEKFPGEVIDWSEILEDLVWICDEVGNTMRRYVLLLDKLTFKNSTTRTKTLKVLANKGIKRQSVHEVWDAATILLPNLRTNTPSGSTHTSQSLTAANNFADKVIQRLQPVYERFDKSLRKAEIRVCDDLRESWIQVYKPELVRNLDSKSFSSNNSQHSGNSINREFLGEVNVIKSSKASSKASKGGSRSGIGGGLTTGEGEEEEEAICTCCYDSFRSNESIYVTNCAHAFHVVCLDDWFRQSHFCPICKEDFSQVPEEEI